MSKGDELTSAMGRHAVPWHHCRGQRSSGRPWPGHRKKAGLCGTLARSRGQDGTGLDTEKKVTWQGGLVRTPKKKSEGHSPAQAQDTEKRGGVCNWPAYWGKATHCGPGALTNWRRLGRCGIGGGSGNDGCDLACVIRGKASE